MEIERKIGNRRHEDPTAAVVRAAVEYLDQRFGVVPVEEPQQARLARSPYPPSTFANQTFGRFVAQAHLVAAVEDQRRRRRAAVGVLPRRYRAPGDLPGGQRAGSSRRRSHLVVRIADERGRVASGNRRRAQLVSMSPPASAVARHVEIEGHIGNRRHVDPATAVVGAAIEYPDQHLGVAAVEEPEQARLARSPDSPTAFASHPLGRLVAQAHFVAAVEDQRRRGGAAVGVLPCRNRTLADGGFERLLPRRRTEMLPRPSGRSHRHESPRRVREARS